MKTPLCLSLDEDIGRALRLKAIEYDVSISDLASMALKYALARITPEAARAYAAAQQPTRGRLGGGLTLGEKAVLAGLEKLKAEEPLAWKQMAQDIASAAGLRLRDAYPALTRLQSRGVLEYGPGEGEADRWGRRPRSLWWKLEDRQAWEARQAQKAAAEATDRARSLADKARFEEMRASLTQEEIDAINGV